MSLLSIILNANPKCVYGYSIFEQLACYHMNVNIFFQLSSKYDTEAEAEVISWFKATSERGYKSGNAGSGKAAPQRPVSRQVSSTSTVIST